MSIPGPKVSVILQTATTIRDSGGETDTAWADTETIKVVLTTMSGREAVKYQKDTTLPLYTLWMEGKKPDRTARTVDDAQRIKWNTQIFDILLVDNLFEANDIIKLDLQDITNAGAV